MKRLLERLGLVALSLSFFLVLEGGLRAVGFGSDDYGALDFGIGATDSLFTDDAEHPGMMVVAPWVLPPKGTHRKLINDDTFPKKRPAGELRIVAVGDSAVFGYPRGGPIAFPYQLGERVRAAHPELQVRVINLGVPGYDVRRTVKALREALTYEPSAVVLYSGHNEYLRRFALESLSHMGPTVRMRQRLSKLRLYQLLGRMLAPVTGRVAGVIDVSDAAREMEKFEGFSKPRTELETRLVTERFRNNVQLAIDAARAAKVPLILCTVISQVQWMPIYAVYGDDDSRERRNQAEAFRSVIARLQGLGDYGGMEEASREAIALVPRHAHFHHYLGTALLEQGRLDEALAEYVKARDLESTQRRGGVAFNDAVRELGARGGCTVVDLEKVFFADMTHGCWGGNLFIDHCHPDAEGHAIVAGAIYDAVDWTKLRR
ncbi:MAG: hypothetical protein U0166_17255 [Acidobacteriota bacterium]